MRYLQRKHKKDKQESPWFNVSKDDDDDDDIDKIEQTLIWIGFNTISSRDALQIDIEKFEDMLELVEKDISYLEYSYLKRTAADGRLIFGMQQT